MALTLTLSHPTSFHLPRIPDLFVGQGLLLLAILAPEADPKQHVMAWGSIHLWTTPEATGMHPEAGKWSPQPTM